MTNFRKQLRKLKNLTKAQETNQRPFRLTTKPTVLAVSMFEVNQKWSELCAQDFSDCPEDN